MSDFDFDYWRELAEQDPPAYFRLRAAMIKRFIATHHEHTACLQELQGRIDSARAISGGPVESCRAIGLMMGWKLAELSVQIRTLQGATRQLQKLADQISPLK